MIDKIDKIDKDYLLDTTFYLQETSKIGLLALNITKTNKTIEIIGCESFFLKTYLENKFTYGMSWDKFGKEIHIDHIIPLSSAKNEEEVLKLCHYTNLQPLWSEDNLKKGNKLL